MEASRIRWFVAWLHGTHEILFVHAKGIVSNSNIAGDLSNRIPTDFYNHMWPIIGVRHMQNLFVIPIRLQSIVDELCNSMRHGACLVGESVIKTRLNGYAYFFLHMWLFYERVCNFLDDINVYSIAKCLIHSGI